MVNKNYFLIQSINDSICVWFKIKFSKKNKIKFILEKLDISQNEFSNILKSEKVDHQKYKNIAWIFNPKKNFLLELVKKFAKDS